MFIKYILIGILNTSIHWGIFGICFSLLDINQSNSNLYSFLVAVTFSFFMNARFTFKKAPTGLKYILFIVFIGALSFLTGFVADHFAIYPIVTLVVFSALNLVLGFMYSKLIVFK